MRKYLLILFALTLHAQTITITGPGTAPAGGTATLTVSISGTAASNPTILQWSMALPSGWTIGTPATTSSDPAGDQVYCFLPICMLAGTATKLSDGNVGTIPVNVPNNAAIGPVTIPLSGLFAADANGFNINGLLAGTPYTITVSPSPCDVNGDGQINVTDVISVIMGAIGKSSCPITVANGGCTVSTVMFEIIAASGGACKVP